MQTEKLNRGAESPVYGVRQVTLKLDIGRFDRMENASFSLREGSRKKSKQDILVEALDDWFAKHNF